jgi:CheY-like chemotaxis protein
MRKLLHVEDNEDNLYMLQLRFDVLGGYEVLSARDGAAGMAMAARNHTAGGFRRSPLRKSLPAGNPN